MFWIYWSWYLLRSAVGMTHDLRSDLWWTIPFHFFLGQFGIPYGSHTIKSALARHTGVQVPLVPAKVITWSFWREPQAPGHLCVWLGLTWSCGIQEVSQNWPSKMRSGIVHHKSDRKSCVIPTVDRNTSTTHFKLSIGQNGSITHDGAVLDLFFSENSPTFESDTKVVPGVELSYRTWNMQV